MIKDIKNFDPEVDVIRLFDDLKGLFNENKTTFYDLGVFVSDPYRMYTALYPG
jgi:hypothetical protein